MGKFTVNNVSNFIPVISATIIVAATDVSASICLVSSIGISRLDAFTKGSFLAARYYTSAGSRPTLILPLITAI